MLTHTHTHTLKKYSLSLTVRAAVEQMVRAMPDFHLIFFNILPGKSIKKTKHS